MATKFTQVYSRFLGKITDDMYMELTPEDTIKDLQHMLVNAIPGFEFPRKNLNSYVISIDKKPQNELEEDDFVIGSIWGNLEEETKPAMVLVEQSYFDEDLTSEEINILAILMMESWVQRQVTSIENTRMKYSGSDFKMTSQANHLSKLLSLLTEVQRQSLHMQRLYKRRKTSETGGFTSNWSVLREVSAIDD